MPALRYRCERDQYCADESGRNYNCGRRATRALDALVRGQEVRCPQRDGDQYGRIVATCSAAGVDLGAEMVRQGFAVAYTRYSRQDVNQGREAKAARRGI
jgi:endonuclease YncB( thermonuclease family)